MAANPRGMNEDTTQAAMHNAMMMMGLSVMGFLLQLGFLFVALLLVRKVNRQASMLLASASLISLLLALAHPLVTVALPFWVGTDGSPAAQLSAHGAVSTLMGILGMVAGMLQLVGIVKLVQGYRGDSKHLE